MAKKVFNCLVWRGNGDVFPSVDTVLKEYNRSQQIVRSYIGFDFYRIMDLFNIFQMSRFETFLDMLFLARIEDGSFLRASSLAFPIAPPWPFTVSTASVKRFASI